MEQKSKELSQSKPGLNLSDRTIKPSLERVWVSPTKGWDNFLSLFTCQGTLENAEDVWAALPLQKGFISSVTFLGQKATI